MPDAARTAIIAAIQQELQGVLAAVPGAQSRTIGGQQFWFGRWHGHELALATSGMGKVAAAQAATLLAACCGARRVLLAGTAGALDAGLEVGDAVVARAFVQHDMDASPLFPRFEVPLTGRSHFDTDAPLADALAQAARAALPGTGDGGLGLEAPRVHEGLVLTGDRFVSGSEERAALKAALPDALAAEMEGAAIAQVCSGFALPFAALRIISDKADASALLDFNRFLESVASRRIHAVLDALLQHLPPV
ncbi:MAG: 5'-methylthioadenosine/adenosylhomocysteine nucleosidase [Ottowia sp.]|nr:5'-methylthioadenosine/adenosylhomocysteine nucleosidase [Ottowia sp.]